MIEQNYQGYLLAAHPKRSEPFLKKSTILVIEHDNMRGARGLQLNKQFINDVTFQTIMHNSNLSFDDPSRPLYHGGPAHTNRVNVVHSLDWWTPSTIKLNDQIGVSQDMSVLVAISNNEGPEYFRACAGMFKWAPSNLEGEITGEDPWEPEHVWSFSPATLETVFELDEQDQWHAVINESNRLQISSWF
jgi:putative transcriptional regulator